MTTHTLPLNPPSSLPSASDALSRLAETTALALQRWARRHAHRVLATRLQQQNRHDLDRAIERERWSAERRAFDARRGL